MEELYQMIEDKIKAAGYTGPIDGGDIYDELCDFIEDKDTGAYIFLSKKTDTIIYEYQLQVMDEEFNLSSLKITTPEKVYMIDFDS